MNQGSRRWPHAVGAGVLGLMAAVLFELWALGRMPIRGDAGAYFAPLRLRLSEAFAEGLPLTWDPLNDGGTSLWANPQAQLFYPPGLAASVADPLGSAGLLTSLHLLFLAVGLLALLRARGHRELDAAPAVLCVGLSGVLLSLTAMQDKLHSLAWVPWILLGATRSLRGERGGGPLLCTGLAAAICAGGVDMLIVCAPLGIGVLLEQRLGPDGLRGFGRMAGWVAAGVGLAAVQWLPLLLALSDSTLSGGQGADALLSRALHPGDLLGLVAPNLGYHPEAMEYFLPWEATSRAVWLPGIYLGGAGAVFLALGLAACQSDARPRRDAALLALFLILALGPLVPGVAWLLTEAPLLSGVRYPQKWLLPALVPTAALIAEGARSLRSPAGRVRGMRLGGALVVVGLGSLTVGAAGLEEPWARAAALLGQGLGLGGLVVLLWSREGRATWLALAVLGLDLAVHNLPVMPRVSPDDFWRPPPVAEALRTLPERPRLWSWSYMSSGRDPAVPEQAPLHEVLRDNLFSGYAAAFGFGLPYGWLSLHPLAHERHFSEIRSLPPAARVEALRRAGVTHILAHFREEAEGLSRLPGLSLLGIVPSTWNAVSVFAVEDPYPECRLTALEPAEPPGQPLRILEDRGNALVIDLPPEATGRVVCLRPWSRGWSGRRGEAAVPTEGASGYQLSALVEPGTTGPLELRYEVPGARWAAGLSASSGLLLLALVARGRREDDDA